MPPPEPISTASITILSKLMDSPLSTKSWLRRLGRLWLEGALFTACSLVIANAIRIPQSGFFAVFLAAAGLTPAFTGILDHNRASIQVGGVGPWKANTASAANLLALFVGAFSAFAAAALWLGEARMGNEFRFVLDTASLGSDTIVTREFASPLPLLAHNGLVLLVFFTLTFVYRAYGALLALVWNACIWALVMAFLVRRGMKASAIPATIYVTVAAVAVLPHLILEAVGYILGGLSAVFLSRAVFKYPLRDPVFRSVLRSVVMLTLASVACLLAAALVESTLPRLVLPLLTPRSAAPPSP